MPIHDWTRVTAGIFHHFHHDWTTELARALNSGRLPPGYYALAEQVAAGPIPDVLTLQHQSDLPSSSNGAGGIAVAEMPPKVRFVLTAEPEQYAAKANYVAIHHPLGQVVAVIEIVSPGNKDSRNAIAAFVNKMTEFLRNGIHLLVIDLFPPTNRDPHGIHKAIWDEIKEEPFELPADKPLTLASYSAGLTKTAFVEPVAVGDVLTEMPLFFDANNYVPAPLEPTYETTWSLCPAPMRKLLTPDSVEKS